MCGSPPSVLDTHGLRLENKLVSEKDRKSYEQKNKNRKAGTKEIEGPNKHCVLFFAIKEGWCHYSVGLSLDPSYLEPNRDF